MHIRQYLVSCLLFLSLFSLNAAVAQDSIIGQAGTSVPGSYQPNGLDTINLQNGAVSINFPLVSYPQVGSKLKLSYSLHSFSNPYPFHLNTYTTTNGIRYVGTWSLINSDLLPPGGSHPALVRDQNLRVGTGTLYYPCTGTNGKCDTTGSTAATSVQGTLTMLFTADGQRHDIGISAQGTSKAYFGPTYDGTNYVPVMSATSPAVTQVTGPDGVKHAFGQYGMSDTDPDGNTITATGAGLLDSAGRSIPNPAGIATSDLSSCPQNATSATAWTVPGPNSLSNTYKSCFATISYSTAFPQYAYDAGGDEIVSQGQASGSGTYLVGLVLPDNTRYTFTYDSWAYLSSVTLPTGGTISYTYQLVVWGPEGVYPISRSLATRTVTDSDGAQHTWTYTYAPASAYPARGTTLVTDPNGNDELHAFGVDETVTHYQGSQSQNVVLRTEVKSSWNVQLPFILPGNNGIETAPGPLASVVTTLPNGATTETDYGYTPHAQAVTTYDYGNNSHDDSSFDYPAQTAYVGTWQPTSTTTYDYGNGMKGSAITSSSTSYYWQTNSAYQQANMLDLPASVSTSGGAPTSFGYDENNGSPSGVFGHQTSTTTTLPSGDTIGTQTIYNTAGIVTASTDANGNQTQVTTFDCGKLFPGKVTAADSTITTFTHDCATGAVVSTTDPLGHAVNVSFDQMGRESTITFADNSKTTWSYPSTGNNKLTQCSLVGTGATTVDQISTLDGFGRTTKLEVSSGGVTDSTVDMTYDGVGNLASVSSPYRSTSGSSAPTSSQPGTSASTPPTTYTYDALGRTVIVTNPDNTKQQWCYDNLASMGQKNCAANASSVGSGSTVDFSDEHLNHWQQIYDGAGRIVAAMEPPSASTAMTETDYSLDPQGNLLTVTQHGVSGETPRVRQFNYDSLSRLVNSCNPETTANGHSCDRQYWSDTYGYDANGNMTSKTDADNNTLGYIYDSMNRLVRINANGDGSTFNYDAAGRFVGHGKDGVSGEVYTLDALGRSISTTWCKYIPGNGCINQQGFTIHYDLGGNATSIAYPDGRTIQQNWDSFGHLQSIQDVTSGGSNAVYFSGTPGSASTPALYTAFGALQSGAYGNGVSRAMSYNDRQQVCRSIASSSAVTSRSGGNVYDRSTIFNPQTQTTCGDEAANNGNVYGSIDNLQQSRSQYYRYDSLNRLQAAIRTDAAYQQVYSYDSFGNMTASDTGSTIPAYVIHPNNQLDNSTGGYSYSNAGRLLQAPNPASSANPHTFFYEPNGLLRCFDGCGNIGYLNNALGQRNYETRPTGATWPVYLNGQVMTEYTDYGTVTDYIYANGDRIAKVGNTKGAFHLHGVRNGSTNLACGSEGPVSGVPAGIAGYVIQAGDRLLMTTMQTLPTYGGLAFIFNDGTGSGSLVDQQTGTPFYTNGVADGKWHSMVGDLTPFAGETINFVLSGIHNSAPQGTFDMYIADAVLETAAGETRPILTGQPATDPYFNNDCGALNASSSTDSVSVSDAVINTTYYLSDQVGTAQVELSGGGWPIWRGQFTPFGQEIGVPYSIGGQSSTGTTMKFKFSGKKRDNESGLDYFGARYYGSSMGRFLAPDPAGNSVADFANPQSWNMYTYVLNNPLKYIDPNGLDCAYLNDAGSELEESDNRSSISECSRTGGYWVSGAVNSLTVDDNGGYHFGNTSQDPDGRLHVTTYDNYLGPNTDTSLSSAYSAASSLLSDFLTGSGPDVRNYDMNSIQGRDLLNSKGIQQLNARIKAGCAAGVQAGKVQLSTGRAYANLPYDVAHSPTGGQVGGYAGGRYKNNGSSTNITFQNIAGSKSFFYHLAPDRPAGSKGPARSITQNFTLSEPNPCTHQ